MKHFIKYELPCTMPYVLCNSNASHPPGHNYREEGKEVAWNHAIVTSQAPPGANKSNFVTISVLINTEQIRNQSAQGLLIYEMIPEWHYLGKELLCGTHELKLAIKALVQNRHISQTQLQCCVPFSLEWHGFAKWDRLIWVHSCWCISDHPGVASTKPDKQNMQSST